MRAVAASSRSLKFLRWTSKATCNVESSKSGNMQTCSSSRISVWSSGSSGTLLLVVTSSWGALPGGVSLRATPPNVDFRRRLRDLSPEQLSRQLSSRYGAIEQTA